MSEKFILNQFFLIVQGDSYRERRCPSDKADANRRILVKRSCSDPKRIFVDNDSVQFGDCFGTFWGNDPDSEGVWNL